MGIGGNVGTSHREIYICKHNTMGWKLQISLVSQSTGMTSLKTIIVQFSLTIDGVIKTDKVPVCTM